MVPARPGLTLNLPLPPGATGDVVRAALDQEARATIEEFGPDWVLVSCGFDAHRDDPLSDLQLSSGDFAELARIVREFAPGRAGSPSSSKAGTTVLRWRRRWRRRSARWSVGAADRRRRPADPGAQLRGSTQLHARPRQARGRAARHLTVTRGETPEPVS